MSLICSSLQWLQDAQRQSLHARSASGKGAADAGTAEHGRGEVGDNTGSSDEEPDWMKEHSARQEEEAQRQAEEKLTQRLQAVREGLAAKRTAARKEQVGATGNYSTAKRDSGSKHGCECAVPTGRACQKIVGAVH